MDIRDKVVVVTGAGSGIGEAVAHRFAAGGARGVLVVDQFADRAEAVSSAIEAAAGAGRAAAFAGDLRKEATTVAAIAEAERRWGPVDLFHANAGVGREGGEQLPDEAWLQVWEINVQAHIHAARALIPGWVARGEGYLVTTASAAGLLTQLGSAPYAVTKHAALAFAEWLAITYAEKGVRVSCLCPMGVATRMTMGEDFQGRDDTMIRQVRAAGAMLEPRDVAEHVAQAVSDERFLVLPHPEVATFFQRKASDYDRWLNGMRRMQARVDAGE